MEGSIKISVITTLIQKKLAAIFEVRYYHLTPNVEVL